MRLIALETATDVCSVALLDDDRVTVELTLNRPRSHAEYLVTLVRDALRYGSVAPQTLDAVAVSQGPGSYTGLRIGVSAAKGLSAALDVPLVAVPSLEACAAGLAPVAAPGDVVAAAFNARRHEIYAAAFRVAEDGGLTPLGETVAIETGSVPEWRDALAGRRVWLVGEGADALAAMLEAGGAATVHRPGAPFDVPSAAWTARLARPRLQSGQVEDVAAFEPFYLKPFVAKKPKGSIFERLTF